MSNPAIQHTQTKCFHCGNICDDSIISFDEKSFCCNGCQMVYGILQQHKMDNYYCLNSNPGVRIEETASQKFRFLDDENTVQQLIDFKNNEMMQVSLYLPQIHCSSCLWLLENLYSIHDGFASSRVNFHSKTVTIHFYHAKLGLRQVAEILTSIGYEPHISLHDKKPEPVRLLNKTAFKLGVTGFCFANIMLISFPEYLGLSFETDRLTTIVFRYLNLLLCLPALLFGAREFFVNAVHSIRQRILNIDAPIALAITVAFIRSVYEIVSNTGAGYLDSMTGIIFFMLIGRALQNKTHASLKFERDFRSYFPISVTTIEDGKEKLTPIQDIKPGDILQLQHLEIVPVDCLLSKGQAQIDYSFVTGENEQLPLKHGELIYAGGKITGSGIEVLVTKAFSQSRFTQLWNNDAFKTREKPQYSFITVISKYFSIFLLLLASAALAYWQWQGNPQNGWNAFTAVLIVACPCTLLLAATFTHGFVMELFAQKGFFIRTTHSLERLAEADHIVFDKTGTITHTGDRHIQYIGKEISAADFKVIINAMRQSMHPLSKAISKYYAIEKSTISHWKETEGKGIEVWENDTYYKIGSASFVNFPVSTQASSTVYVSIDNIVYGYFMVETNIRPGIDTMLLHSKAHKLSLLSGDNDHSKKQMRSLFPQSANLLFQQTPQQKLDYIQHLQQQGNNVLMVGDGLNDAGALQQSNMGIAIVQESFSFSPACDGILHASELRRLHQFIAAAKASNRLIKGLFIYSLLYNAVGLSFAVSAGLEPIIAAILMPASSISVILIAWLGTKRIGKKYFANI